MCVCSFVVARAAERPWWPKREGRERVTGVGAGGTRHTGEARGIREGPGDRGLEN